MLILYTKTGCPFCERVVDKLDKLGVSFDERNIADEENLKELLEKGGNQQVPYLVDEGKNIEMYESGDIISYLNKEYGTGDMTDEAEDKDDDAPKVCPI